MDYFPFSSQYPPNSYKVLLGSHHQTVTEFSEQLYNVSRIILHPDHQSGMRHQTGNNLALLRVSGRIRYTDTVSPVCLTERDFPAGQTCIITGWGQAMGRLSYCRQVIYMNSQFAIGFNMTMARSKLSCVHLQPSSGTSVFIWFEKLLTCLMCPMHKLSIWNV